jgi:hypothetical protein
MEGDVEEEEEEEGCGEFPLYQLQPTVARNTFALGARELANSLSLSAPPAAAAARSLARSNALRHHRTLAVAYQSMIPKPVPSSRLSPVGATRFPLSVPAINRPGEARPLTLLSRVSPRPRVRDRVSEPSTRS